MNVHGKFDMAEKPRKPSFFWAFVELFLSRLLLLSVRHRYVKHGFRRVQGPALILSTHASFIDFPMAYVISSPRSTRWVCSIEEFNGREWLFRHIGVICKRKFTNDIVMVRHILNALRKERANVIIYPEARFSLAGINERLDGSLGKLAKAARVPVYVLNCHGNFIRSPQWNKHPYRKIPMVTDVYRVVDAKEAVALPEAEIQRRIEEAFVADDYAWQAAHQLRVTSPERATNLHKILYQCPHCGQEHVMASQGIKLWCTACGATYTMDELGHLARTDGVARFTEVPAWYRWERSQVREQVRQGTYVFEDDAYLEELVSSAEGFIRRGTVRFRQDHEGISLVGTLDDGTSFSLHKPVHSMYSIHIEYDFKGRGDALDIATIDDTWFLFPVHAQNVLTKIHFATEELFDYDQEQKDGK